MLATAMLRLYTLAQIITAIRRCNYFQRTTGQCRYAQSPIFNIIIYVIKNLNGIGNKDEINEVCSSKTTVVSKTNTSRTLRPQQITFWLPVTACAF